MREGATCGRGVIKNNYKKRLVINGTYACKEHTNIRTKRGTSKNLNQSETKRYVSRMHILIAVTYNTTYNSTRMINLYHELYFYYACT